MELTIMWSLQCILLVLVGVNCIPVEKIGNQQDVCRVGNQTVNIGDKYNTGDPCTTCICQKPPDLSCISSLCAEPPRKPNTVCVPNLTSGQCCPEFTCTPAASTPEEKADPCLTASCDAPPSIPDAICKEIRVEGQCCPSYGCVPNQAPVIFQ